ncbi:GntR family transcriptional regulator [Spirillospora sp. NPDC048832]
MAVSYRDIAADLRRSILRGRYRQGDTLPKLEALAEEYGAAYQTVRSAIGMLAAEGLVEAVKRRGTVVRELPDRRRITRSRQVYQDERGYYFDPTAQTWTPVQAPAVGWGPAPLDIAPLLGVAPGSDVLIRERLMGPDTSQAKQVATSYLPEWLARGTVLAERDTGPGGIYARLEEMGHAPLRWSESVSARMPTPDESQALGLARGVPVLRVVRTTSGPDRRVLEINDTRMSAEEFEIGYSIRRSPSARKPRDGSHDQSGEAR